MSPASVYTYAGVFVLGMIVGAACCVPWINYLEEQLRRFER